MSLVLGILAFFCFGIPAGIAAVVTGALAKNKGCTSPMATAGIICGAIAMALAIVALLAFSIVD